MSHELVLELASTLAAVGDDLGGLLDATSETGDELWPTSIIEAMEELLALRATLRKAVEMAPEMRPALVRAFRSARAEADWDPPRFPTLPMLPETIERIEAVEEHLRRERLLDRELDRACGALPTLR